MVLVQEKHIQSEIQVYTWVHTINLQLLCNYSCLDYIMYKLFFQDLSFLNATCTIFYEANTNIKNYLTLTILFIFYCLSTFIISAKETVKSLIVRRKTTTTTKTLS